MLGVFQKFGVDAQIQYLLLDCEFTEHSTPEWCDDVTRVSSNPNYGVWFTGHPPDLRLAMRWYRGSTRSATSPHQTACVARAISNPWRAKMSSSR